MVFYKILVHAHSGFRWILLLLMLLTLTNAFIKWIKKSTFTDRDRWIITATTSVAHLQLIIGLVLYFISPKVVFDPSSLQEPYYRFFLVEHIVLMLAAIGLITAAMISVKRATTSIKKFKRAFYFNLIALILILFSIPWPFQDYGTSWF